MTMLAPTIWQQNVADFATTADDWIDQERRAAVRKAMAAIVDGRLGYAHFVLVKSVMRQARAAGLSAEADALSTFLAGLAIDEHLGRRP